MPKDSMFDYFAFFAIAFFISSVLTPLVRKIAKALGVVDEPNGRKVHAVAKPRLGGTAIALAFGFTLVLAAFVHRDPKALFGVFSGEAPVRALVSHALGQRFFLGALIVFLLGVWDDWRGTNARVKLCWQAVAATVVVFGREEFGILQAYGFTSPLAVAADLAFSVFWVCLVTNALNLIDGLDGLAAGTCFLACVAYFLLGVAADCHSVGILVAVLGGATLGFLRYNLHPAQIFMGDSGSLFLGFALSVVSLRLFTVYSTHGLAVLAPALALGLPLADTALAIVRRWVKYSHVLHPHLPFRPFRLGPIFQADRHHLHHRLLAIGHRHNGAVNLLYLATIALTGLVAAIAFLNGALGPWGHVAIYGATLFAFYALTVRLGYGTLFREDVDDPAAAAPPISLEDRKRASGE